jgi:hypothetical protein
LEKGYIPPDEDLSEPEEVPTECPVYIPSDDEVMKVDKTKKQIRKEEERKEARTRPSSTYLSFSRKLYQYGEDKIIAELEEVFGKREPTPAQKAAGVTHGIYRAEEYNKACESLAVKAGIKTRKGEEVDLEEEVNESQN